MEEEKKMIGTATILYSTQSGRAKACARRAGRIIGEECDVDVQINSEFDEVSIAELQDSGKGSEKIGHLWLLFVSTTGQGQHCDSIQQTWKWLLNRRLPADTFSSVRFCLFCLGDRAYGDDFCAAGRKLGARLKQLGASPACSVGYGDDGTQNGGVFYDLDLWIEEEIMATVFQRKTPNSTTNLGVMANEYEVSLLKSLVEGGQHADSDAMEEFFSKSCPITSYDYQDGQRLQPLLKIPPLRGVLSTNDRLTNHNWQQDVRHLKIELEAESYPILYNAGDIASIYPSNSESCVNYFLSVIPDTIANIADNLIQISSARVSHQSCSIPWPSTCTLRTWLTHCADIHGLPEREDLRSLAKYCVHEEQKEKLISLSETTGSALYNDYILRERRSWGDVLYDFDGIQLTLQSLFELIPAIRPRHFSIASASSRSHMELCVAVIEGKTPLGRSYQGLCSSYLASLEKGAVVRFWFQPGSFQLPMQIVDDSFKVPILYIGAGTGIAPLRGLILERESKRMNHSNGKQVKPGEVDSVLIFGCRKSDQDFLYKNEWEGLSERGYLEVFTAFSRDQWHKIYVQQVMGQNQEMIANHILHRGGMVFIAGGAKMAQAVKNELLEILTPLVGGGKQSKLLLKKMQKESRLVIEAWS